MVLEIIGQFAQKYQCCFFDQLSIPRQKKWFRLELTLARYILSSGVANSRCIADWTEGPMMGRVEMMKNAG